MHFDVAGLRARNRQRHRVRDEGPGRQSEAIDEIGAAAKGDAGVRLGGKRE